MDDSQTPNSSAYEAADREDPEEVSTNGPLDNNELEGLLKSNEKRTLVYLGVVFWITVIIVLGAVFGTSLAEKLRLKNEGCVHEECHFRGPTPASTPPISAPTAGPQPYFYMLESVYFGCLEFDYSWQKGGQFSVCNETNGYQQWNIEYSDDGEEFTISQINPADSRWYSLQDRTYRKPSMRFPSATFRGISMWTHTESGGIRNSNSGRTLYVPPNTNELIMADEYDNAEQRSTSFSFVQMSN